MSERDPHPTQDDAASGPDESPVYTPPAGGSMFQIGCSWLVIGSLTILTALAAGTWWVTANVQNGRLVQQLPISFQDLSLLPAAHVAPDEPETILHLYFATPGQTLGAIERRMPTPAGAVERTHLAAREMMRPPLDGLLRSAFPPGVELRGVYLVEGVALVDLSREFLSPVQPTAQKERLAIYGIVNNLMLNNTELRGVRLMIEGAPVNSAWGWMDLSSPLGPDLSLIQ